MRGSGLEYARPQTPQVPLSANIAAHDRRYLAGLLCSQLWSLPSHSVCKNDLECRMPSPQLRALSLFPAAIGSLLLALPASGQSQVSAINSPDGKPLSQRVVAYWIDAQLDTDAKTLDATEILEYRNPSDQPVSTIPFHLYLNAFRPQSTFARESHQEGLNLYRDKEEQGAIDIKSIAARGLWGSRAEHALHCSG